MKMLGGNYGTDVVAVTPPKTCSLDGMVCKECPRHSYGAGCAFAIAFEIAKKAASRAEVSDLDALILEETDAYLARMEKRKIYYTSCEGKWIFVGSIHLVLPRIVELARILAPAQKHFGPQRSYS